MINFECLATDRIGLKSFIDKLPDCKLKTKCKKSGGKEFIRKYFTSDEISDHNIKKGTVLNYITKETIDRDGDVIKLAGIKMDNFLGAVYWNHDYSQLPVAKNIWAKNDGQGILAATTFLDKTEHQRGVKSMYTEDVEGTGPVLKSFSMGFIPTKFHYATDIDKKAYGASTKLVFDEIEMFEYSAVGIPANRDALTVAVGKGFTFDDQEFLPKTVIKIIMETKSFSHNSKVSSDEPKWGGVDKTELPWKSFVFETEGFDKTKKSTWSFPHHWVKGGGNPDENGVLQDGELLLHEQGLNVAFGAAQGARSGKKADQSVLAHLEKHRKALGKTDEGGKEKGITKSVDIDGAISVDDIKDAILMALNPPTLAIQDNRLSWGVEELFPSDYPNGHVIVEAMNFDTLNESPRKWRYEYRMEGKKALLFTPVEVEERLVITSGVVPDTQQTDSQKSIEKAGRMLNSKNRSTIHKAMSALQSVLDADNKKTIKIVDNADNDSKEKFTKKDFESIIKAVSDITKGTIAESFKDFKDIRNELDDVASIAIRKTLGKVS